MIPISVVLKCNVQKMQQNIKLPRACMRHSNAETRMSLSYSKLQIKVFRMEFLYADISNKKVQNISYIFFSLGEYISYKCKG